jgi:hypothetical protein
VPRPTSNTRATKISSVQSNTSKIHSPRKILSAFRIGSSGSQVADHDTSPRDRDIGPWQNCGKKLSKVSQTEVLDPVFYTIPWQVDCRLSSGYPSMAGARTDHHILRAGVPDWARDFGLEREAVWLINRHATPGQGLHNSANHLTPALFADKIPGEYVEELRQFRAGCHVSAIQPKDNPEAPGYPGALFDRLLLRPRVSG